MTDLTITIDELFEKLRPLMKECGKCHMKTILCKPKNLCLGCAIETGLEEISVKVIDND